MSLEHPGRDASPTTAILDAQSDKGAVKGCSLDPSGYVARKKVLGRKRHVLVDTQGSPLNVKVYAADIQDRTAPKRCCGSTTAPHIHRAYRCRRRLRRTKDERSRRRTVDWTFQIVKRRSNVRGFVVLPKSWIAERTLAWISRNRHLSRD